MELEQNPTTEIAPLSTIRVATVLSRHPVHRLARKGNIKIDVTEQNQHGETALQWKVSYNSEYGQPGPLAYKVDTLIINRRIEEATRPVPRIIKLGSLHDICRELGISEGKNIVSIKNALYQNASAFITAKVRYKDSAGSEKTLESGFTRYSVVLTGEKLPDDRKADGVYIVLNDVFMQVISGAMTRPLDYDYLKSLPPAPQRFYELLSFQMYAALKYDLPRAKLVYSEFCAHAPQTRHVEWEKVRSQMNKIHKLHLASGYIGRFDCEQITAKDGKPDWIMLYQPGPKARAEFKAFNKKGGPVLLEIEPLEPSLLDAVETSPLERALIERGVTETSAKDLVRQHSEEKITAQIERFDYQIGKKNHKIGEPAAYLVSAIRDDYAPPKGFISAAERQRRAEAKEAAEKSVKDQSRQRDEMIAADRRENLAVEAYWKSLSVSEQSILQAQADALADPETIKIEFGPLKKLGQSTRRSAYIRQMLRDRQK